MYYVYNILVYRYMHLFVLLPYIIYVCVVSYCVHWLVDMLFVSLCTAGIIQNLRDSMNLRSEPSALRPVLYRSRRRPAGYLFYRIVFSAAFRKRHSDKRTEVVAVLRGLRKDVAVLVCKLAY